jgi:CDP-2,3-bis-(O-geranylgeranyl)-sn-glycerol synthase
MDFQIVSELILLLMIANGAPVIASRLFGQRLACPLDGNIHWRDKRRLLGPSKTLRGLVSAALACALLASLFGLTPAQGAGFGLLAMLGDALSSFLKRRLGIAPSHSAPLIDQLPEALLPLWLMNPVLGATASESFIALFIFLIIDLVVSRLHDRLQPQ